MQRENTVPEMVQATTAEQVEHVRGLFRAYQSELPQQYCFAHFDKEVAGLPGEYSPPAGALLLATISGQPAGCVGLRPFPITGTCEMKRLYVRPQFRSYGLGKKLVEAVIHLAGTLGYQRLRLDTHPPTMERAIEMYRRIGFVTVTADPGTAVAGLLYMELPLVSPEQPNRLTL